jgi:hypothetical protein
MTRLQEIAMMFPDTWEGTNGSGFDRNHRRRAVKFAKAVQFLTAQASTADLFELQDAAKQISDQIEARAPAGLTKLSRGYEIALNAAGERTVRRGDTVFSPSYKDAFPDRNALQQFAGDIRTGWLIEAKRAIEAASW